MLADLFTYRWRFEAGGAAIRVTARYSDEGVRIVVATETGVVADHVFAITGLDGLASNTVATETPEGRLEVTVGGIGWWTVACQARLDGVEVFRSHRREFGVSPKLQRLYERIDRFNTEAASPEAKEKAAAQAAASKRRWPSIAVDVSLAVAFFVVARNTDLPTAAITVAALTLGLIAIQPFLKQVDLLGGFAVFGAAMALISAGLSLAFQDELFVKLRGAVMGTIGASAFLIDGLFGGRYLGKRMQGYMESAWPIDPRRCAFALAGVSATLAAVDLAAAFLLPTDAWLIYNAALDSLIAIPFALAALWFARVRTPAS